MLYKKKQGVRKEGGKGWSKTWEEQSKWTRESVPLFTWITAGKQRIADQVALCSLCMFWRNAEECFVRLHKMPPLYYASKENVRLNTFSCNHCEMIYEGNYKTNKSLQMCPLGEKELFLRQAFLARKNTLCPPMLLCLYRVHSVPCSQHPFHLHYHPDNVFSLRGCISVSRAVMVVY